MIQFEFWKIRGNFQKKKQRNSSRKFTGRARSNHVTCFLCTYHAEQWAPPAFCQQQQRLELKLDFCGIKVPICDISWDLLIHSFLIPTLLSSFINLHQEIFVWNFPHTRPWRAWPSHISWQVQLLFRVKSYLLHPSSIVAVIFPRLSFNQCFITSAVEWWNVCGE